MNRIAPAHPQDAPPAAETKSARPAGRRRGLTAGKTAAVLLALVLAGYAGFWTITAIQLRGGVLDWIGDRQEEGYRISHGRPHVGGFPLAAKVTIDEPVIAAPDGRALGWSWAADRAVLEVSPLRPDSVSLRLAGEEVVSVNVGGALKTYRGRAETLMLRIALGPALRSATLVVDDLAMAAEDPGDAFAFDRLNVSGQPVERPAAAEPGAGYAFEIDAAGLRLPRQFDLPLGETLAMLSADAIVGGTLDGISDLPGTLARWRDAGGAIELTRIDLSYGPLTLDGSGSLALDNEIQPVGTLIARMRGFQQTIVALAERGLIDAQAASQAKIALAILGRPGADGGPAELSVPLTLHDRTLSVGAMPLLVVPMIEWPRGPTPRTGGLPSDAFPATALGTPG